MNEIIDYIVNSTYEKYGKRTLFREYDFKPVTINKTTALYRVQSAINYPYMYEIQIHVFDKISHTRSIFDRFYKCLYCNQKGVDYKMRCCGKYLHLECGMKNSFACCHLNMYLAQTSKQECCVCLEDTYTITDCGHPLCETCLANMYKCNSEKKDIKVSCPYCREIIIEETKMMDYINVNVKDNEEVVCVSYI